MSIIPYLIAIPATALLMGGWRKLLMMTIFRNRSRAICRRMLTLTTVARLILFDEISRSFGTEKTTDNDRHSGAIINWLFGDTNELQRRSESWMPTLERDSIRWLDANPKYRELVCRSLVIVWVANSELSVPGYSGDIESLVTRPVFQKHSREFHSMSDPQIYTDLVSCMLAQAPDTVREAVKQLSSRMPIAK